MEPISTGNEIKEIPLDDIVIGKAQVRSKDVGRDIDELANSIRAIGLIYPISVCPAHESGKWEIVTGQRRFLAHRTLGEKTIKAIVYDRPLDEIEAKIISISENMSRVDLATKDKIDVCTYLV